MKCSFPVQTMPRNELLTRIEAQQQARAGETFSASKHPEHRAASSTDLLPGARKSLTLGLGDLGLFEFGQISFPI